MNSQHAAACAVYAYANGNPISYRDPLGLFITSVDAACIIDPQFCAEIMGQMLQNTAAIVQNATGPNPCLQEAADALSGAFNGVGNLAALLPIGGFAFGAFKSEAKWLNQMQQRDWTNDLIAEAIQSGQSIPATNLVNPGNPALRYVSPTTGQSVVVDIITREILHIGGPGFKY